MSKKQKTTFPVPANDIGVFAVHSSRPDLLEKIPQKVLKDFLDGPVTAVARALATKALNEQIEEINKNPPQ